MGRPPKPKIPLGLEDRATAREALDELRNLVGLRDGLRKEVSRLAVETRAAIDRVADVDAPEDLMHLLYLCTGDDVATLELNFGADLTVKPPHIAKMKTPLVAVGRPRSSTTPTRDMPAEPPARGWPGGPGV